jgi:hypothetical protein
MNDGKRLAEFVDKSEKWLEIKVPAGFAAGVLSKIEAYMKRRSFLFSLLKYATAETILVLLLQSMAM